MRHWLVCVQPPRNYGRRIQAHDGKLKITGQIILKRNIQREGPGIQEILRAPRCEGRIFTATVRSSRVSLAR